MILTGHSCYLIRTTVSCYGNRNDINKTLVLLSYYDRIPVTVVAPVTGQKRLDAARVQVRLTSYIISLCVGRYQIKLNVD